MMGSGVSKPSKAKAAAEPDDGDGDEEVYGEEYGHPALYHEAQLGMADGEGGPTGWYADGPEDEHVLDLDEVEDGETPSPPAPLPKVPPPVRERTDSFASKYGELVRHSAEATDLLVPAGSTGLKWHAQILSDSFKVGPKHCKDDGTLKPRRPLPHVRASDFFASLSKTDSGRYVFTGVLNGWPALTNLELVSITLKARSPVGTPAIRRIWNAGDAAPPSFPANKKVTGVRATLRAAAWTASGFSAASPGFAFWFARDGSLTYGEAMLQRLPTLHPRAPLATRVHLFAHRYAKEHESAKDRLTWHAALLLEWEHGAHTTVCELAWLGGLGGYGGKSNWFDDRDAKRPALYHAMAPELKMPWRSNMSEVRLLDVEAASLADFKAYLGKHTGPKARFLDPTIAASADVRLSARSLGDIMRYVLNYVRNATQYSEQSRNCQTFAADLFALLSGDHSTEPFSAPIRVFYKRHLEWLLCDPA